MTTTFVYDQNNIIAEFENGVMKVVYIHGPGVDDPIAMVRDINNDGTFAAEEIFYYAKDHLGSVHALVSSEGKVVQRYNYSAYGKVSVEKTNASDKLIKNPFMYTGREQDLVTGYMHYRARELDPNCGCFLSPDPIGFAGGDVNFYNYVRNNPISYRDPYGLWFANVVGGVLGAGFAAATGGSAGEIALAGVIGFATAGLSLPFQVGLEFLLSTQTTDPNADKVPSPPKPSCDPSRQSCKPKEPQQCGN